MNTTQVLSELQFLDKYSRFDYQKGRRENWQETVTRVTDFLLSYLPEKERLTVGELIFNSILNKEVSPSMRLMATAGEAARLNEGSIFNCFGRETKFVSEFGTVSFFDFNDGDTVKVKTHDGTWKNAVVKNFGKQKLNKITFARARSTKEIRATSNHTWLLKNGERTQSLKPKDIIFGLPDEITDWNFDNASPIEKIAWCYGYVFGDGSVSNKHSMVRLCGEQNKFLDRFLSCGFGSTTSMSLVGDNIVFTGKYLKTTPELSVENLEEIRAFVIGYLDADAAKTNCHGRKKFVSIQSSQDDHIDFIESAFEMVGVYLLNTRDLTGQETNFGIRPNTKHFGLTNRITETNSLWSVKEIVEDVVDDVWCLVVDDNHSFVLSGGIVTGNCSYLPLESTQDFHDLTLLLGLGVGVGFSVENHFVKSLGVVKEQNKNRTVKFVVPDSIYGWAQSIKYLLENKMAGNRVHFDYSLIRPAGSPLKTRGGRASGPEPLMDAHIAIGRVLDERAGKEIRSIDAFDIACHIAGAIVSGGVRRSAMITIFDIDDELMLNAKSGDNFSKNLQRQYANISAVIDEEISEEEMSALIQRMHDSGFGEPGIFSRYAARQTMPERRNAVFGMGVNPCGEVLLRPRQFCNLSQAIVRPEDTFDTLKKKVEVATIIGTIQSSMNHFPELHPDFAKNNAEERLLGVSLSGIMDNPILQDSEILDELLLTVISTNKKWAKILGINESVASTCVKPDGNTSLLYNTSPGLHPRWSPYYIRRVRLQYNNPVAQWLMDAGLPCEPVLGETWENVRTVVFDFPIKSPESSMYQMTASALDQLEMWKLLKIHWTEHNPSVTIHYKPSELDSIKRFCYLNQDILSGVSFLENGHKYVQAPYEEIDEQTYLDSLDKFPEVDYTSFWNYETRFDSTSGTQTLACVGGACLI